jgi:hypothetical protein
MVIYILLDELNSLLCNNSIKSSHLRLGITSRLLNGQQKNYASIPGRKKIPFCSPNCPEELRRRYSLLLDGHRGTFLQEQSGRGAKLAAYLQLV